MPILFLIVLIDLIGFGLVIPLLPFYAERFSASPQEVTVLMATYSFVQMLSAPVWGRLSDRVGRRPVLMISMAAAALAYLWLGFADAMWMLFAARALGGACAGNIAAAQAYVADVTPPEKRARGMGMIGAAFGIGFIIGPALGGVVAGNNLATADLRSPGLIACALSLTAFFGVLFVLKESLPRGMEPRLRKGRIAALHDALARKALARLLLIFFLTILAFGGMEAVFALWAMAQFGWGPERIGYIFAYVGVLSAVMQGGLIGRLTARFGEEKLLITGLSLIALGLVAIPLARDLPLVVVAVSFLALGMGAMQPSLNSLISRRAGAAEQGEVMGVAQSIASLSRVLGPLLAGVLFAGLGRDAPFLAGMVLVVVAAVLGLGIPPAEPTVQPRAAE
ncbi:MAG TPA: MFS transporter [Stellaceae bacterium]|nr:MFS transporter [Stellaceae bacterium]